MTTEQKTYIVATIKDWNIDAYHRRAGHLPGQWHLFTDKDDLTLATVRQINPRYVFFPHWSWIVPKEILESFECVCFHMADVPYGRGGSPLQNLIARGHKETKLTALKMEEELDAGPVYMKKPLSLEGRAQDIFLRVGDLVYDMIEDIVKNEPEPVPQEGEPVLFRRRTPDMSALPEDGSLEDIYDHIRMLDADSYPRAFLDHGDFHLTFRDADMQDNDTLTATVTIKKKT